ncbi:ribonuclease T [Halofilum ochraceum]|uniref:ribonuclease T n=1 Tax=Halofilum ochraceum TaxID=1611323 RepID=UPI0008334BCD|nr:ribonuclease T [Halofilum ochraceum]
MYEPGKVTPMAQRFRGFLPVVVDVETGGFNPRTDALLEIAAVTLRMTDTGELEPDETVSTHVQPFEGANLEPKSLEVTGIDPWHPLRAARNEHDALSYVFQPVRRAVKDNSCTRAILVGHNASFDLSFVNAAVERSGIRRNPFHPFSYLDTVTLGALAYGQTVLARASRAAGLEWEQSEAHSAVYDTQMTARLFCEVVNRWEALHADANRYVSTEEEQ